MCRVQPPWRRLWAADVWQRSPLDGFRLLISMSALRWTLYCMQGPAHEAKLVALQKQCTHLLWHNGVLDTLIS